MSPATPSLGYAHPKSARPRWVWDCTRCPRGCGIALDAQGGCAWGHARRRPPSISTRMLLLALNVLSTLSSLQSCCCGGCCCQTCAFGGCCCKTCVSVSAVAGLSPAYTYTGALSRPRECPNIYDAPNSCFSLQSWHRTCRIVHG